MQLIAICLSDLETLNIDK